MTAALRNTIDTKYEELFRTYFSSLCYFARKYISDHDSSREIVHNVFVTIWEKREEFDFEKPAKSYLFTSVYNRCLNYLRNQKKFVIGTESNPVEVLGDQAVYEDHLEAAELESKIWSTINLLPEKCREVFVMNRFDGKKYGEIAVKLNISVKTVEAQMSKALKTLREHLKDYIHLFIVLLIKSLW